MAEVAKKTNYTNKDLFYAVFNVDIGWVGILASRQGLLTITLPQRSSQQARRALSDRIKYAIWSPQHFDNLIERLKAYFSGHKVEFSDELDLSEATTFEREVWEIAKHIPYGETKSYTWIATQIRKPAAVRAVGQALGRNPLPIIIPCHRVLTIHGSLGGYAGGVEMKRVLLRLETSARM